MSEREVEINGLYAKESGSLKIVLLKDKASATYISIWIGETEADAILDELHKKSVPRPMVHDLLHQLIVKAGGVVQKVVVNALKNNVYYSVIELKLGKKLIELDSRPSDALALAVRADAPIFVAGEVLEVAGQKIDDIADEEGSEGEQNRSATVSDLAGEKFFEHLSGGDAGEPGASFALGNEERRKLSVFSRFLSTLDINPKSTEQDQEKQPPSSG